jgi:hypothetical protein
MPRGHTKLLGTFVAGHRVATWWCPCGYLVVWADVQGGGDCTCPGCGMLLEESAHKATATDETVTYTGTSKGPAR